MEFVITIKFHTTTILLTILNTVFIYMSITTNFHAITILLTTSNTVFIDMSMISIQISNT
jgi:hypothetical protein